MSSTTNVQSYLPYVFRPVYTWTGTNFTTTFNLSNIDTLSVRSAKFGVIYAGDISNNVFIGSNTGNSPADVGNCNASSNTAIGIAAAAAISGTSNSEFVGFQSGSAGKNILDSIVIGVSAALSNSNVSNSILIGTSNSAGLSNINNTICIGGNAGGRGSSNIYIGSSNGVGMTGSSNVLIGNGVNLSNIPGYTLVDGVTPGPSFSNQSNLFMIGSSNKVLIAGNFTNGVVSIGSTNTNANVCNAGTSNVNISNTIPNITLDVFKCMRVQNGLSIGCDPNQGFTLDSVGSFRAQDGYGQIYLSNCYDPVNGVPNGNPSNSVVNMSSTGGSSMTLDVQGTVRASNAIVSNQVSAAGYYSAQSGTAGVLVAGNATLSIPLKNNGLVIATIYDSSSPAVSYSASFMVTNYTSNVAWTASNVMSNAALTFAVAVSNANVVISNSTSGSVTFRYNVTFFPIG
jgi:hypothetical protein